MVLNGQSDLINHGRKQCRKPSPEVILEPL